MQWIIAVFLAIVALVCIVLGLILSSARERRVTTPRQQCAGCGWTKEQVQLCEFERSREVVVAPLCFECAVELEAVPIRPRLRRRTGYREKRSPVADELALAKSR